MSTSSDFLYRVGSHPWRLLAGLAMLLAALSVNLTGFKLSNDFRIYFSEQNPQLKTFNAFEQTFTSPDNLFILIKNPDGLFNVNSLSLIAGLTEQLWQLPFAQRVDSLSNFSHTRAEGDTLYVGPLYEANQPLTSSQLKQLQQTALNEPTLAGYFVSQDGKAAGLNVNLALPESEPRAAQRVVTSARQLLKEYRNRYSQMEFHLGGSVMSNVTLERAVLQDMSTLTPLSLLLIATGLMIFLRSFWLMFATLIVIVCSVWMTFAIWSWISPTLTPVAGFVPSVVLTIAVADCVHLLTTYRYQLTQSSDTSALKKALAINVAPISITSITTAIGVLSLNLSDSPPYQDLGNMVAIGVCCAWLLSLTLLPALLRIRGSSAPVQLTQTDSMQRLARWVLQYRRWCVTLIGGLLLLSLGFLSNNRLTETWSEYFDDTFEARRTLDAIQESLTGVHRLEYMVSTPDRSEGSINEPAYLRQLAQLTSWLKEQPEIRFVSSYSQLQQRLNRDMHAGKSAFYKTPDSRPLAAQYLLLYELSLPQGLSLQQQVTQARDATRLTIIFDKADSEKILALDRRIQHWSHTHLPAITLSEATGLDVIFAHITARNMSSLLFGSVLALFIISLLLALLFRSAKLGAISLLPNLAPAAMAYGLWGMWVGEIDMALSVVIGMSIGIVVDDTVHFLSKYRHGRLHLRLSQVDSIEYAFAIVGKALIITTVVLVTGFMVLTFSHMAPTARTGLMLSIILSIALIVDLFLLPPLLLWWDKSRGPRDPAKT